MSRNHRRVLTLAAMAAVVLGAAELEAQQRGQRRGPPADRAELEQRVRQRFAEVVREQLDLTEEQHEALVGSMQSFQGERMQLMREEQATRRRVEALMLEGDDEAAEAADLVERLVALRESEVALFRAEQEALLEVLTPYQLLRFHALREQFNQRVRRLRGEGGPGRGPGGMEDASGLLPDLDGVVLPSR